VPANRLILGDNREVLARLQRQDRERFRLAYLDPPFNTGRRFDEYDDRASPEAWTSRIEETLGALLPLVRDDGAIAVEIDDTELGALLVLMDRLLGRAQRISVITIVRSAATGHKAINRGPVNVADYLLVYAKDRARFAPNALVVAREGLDPAYSTYVSDPSSTKPAFSPLAREVASRLGFASALAARRSLGADAFRREVERFALGNAAHVVRFAQPRFEAIGKRARAIVLRSRAAPEKVMRLARPGYKDFIVRGGNRMLLLGDKVRTIAGEPRVVESLTNVWDDIGFQGIAKEGGVRFVRNKKPERLLERVLELCTDRGDWVIDPYAGSGTTAAVAHKLGRRWVGIEREPAVWDRANERLGRVVRGEDPTGISVRVAWTGGGAFDAVGRSP